MKVAAGSCSPPAAGGCGVPPRRRRGGCHPATAAAAPLLLKSSGKIIHRFLASDRIIQQFPVPAARVGPASCPRRLVNNPPPLQVHDAPQALQAVQHVVPALDRLQVQRVLHVGPVRLQEARHLVDLAVEAAGGDEGGHLAVDKVRRDAEGCGHAVQRHGLVRLQELRGRDPRKTARCQARSARNPTASPHGKERGQRSSDAD